MFIALVSLLTGRTVRSDTAMTGEISLRGLVLPVGGIKEKVVAAAAAGITRVLLPARNRRDFDDIPSDVREQLEFVWLDERRRRGRCGAGTVGRLGGGFSTGALMAGHAGHWLGWGFQCRCLVVRTRIRHIHVARARHPCLARSCQQDTGTETSSAPARLIVQRSSVEILV